MSRSSFTPAKFDVDEMCKETSIVTSVKNILVIWNFKSVKRGDLQDYEIIKLDEPIVKAEVQYESSDIVVTYPNKLQLLSRSTRN